MRYLCILFLFCAVTTYSQTFYSPVICKLTLRVDDGVRFWGIPGTGSMVTIDADGFLSRGYAGAATVTGLVPTEVLFGKSDGTIEQDADFVYTATSGVLSITGSNARTYMQNVAGTISNDVGYDGVYVANSVTGLYTSLLTDKIQIGNSGGAIDIKKQSGGGAYDINLPNANGTSGQALRLTAGLNLEWFTPSGGSGTVTSIATTSPVLGGTITTTGTISLAGLSGLGTAGQMTRTNAGATAWEYFTPTFLTAAVTSFSFTDAHGFDGTVTNATTTPALELITTVTDNQIMYSTGGDITGSPLFTWDDATNTEVFDATVYDFLVRGTATYGLLGIISDAGNIQFGDISNSVNSTLLTVDDGSEIITIDADNGVNLPPLAGSDNLLYADAGAGKITAVTLTANDFNFSAPTLSIDYANGQEATTSQDGFLSQTDWDVFNEKGFTIVISGSQNTIADATSYYSGATQNNSSGTAGANRIYIPRNCTLVAGYGFFLNAGTAGTGESGTFYVRKNNTTDATVSASVTTNATHNTFNGTGLTATYVAGDYIEGKWLTPTYATNPSNCRWTVTLYFIPN